MYVLMYYLPSTMFVIISWISFFIPPTAYPARFGLLITTVLVLVNTFNNVVTNTPKDANNVTAIVIWMIGCLFFVFSALISYAILILRMRFINNGETNNKTKVKPMNPSDDVPTKSYNMTDMILLCITFITFIVFVSVYFCCYRFE